LDAPQPAWSRDRYRSTQRAWGYNQLGNFGSIVGIHDRARHYRTAPGGAGPASDKTRAICSKEEEIRLEANLVTVVQPEAEIELAAGIRILVEAAAKEHHGAGCTQDTCRSCCASRHERRDMSVLDPP